MKNTLLTLGMSLISAISLAGESIDQSLKADTDGRVVIDNMRGQVTVIGWDKDLVTVQGELDDSSEGYEFRRNGSRVFFELDMPGRYQSKGDGSNLTFYVPQNSTVHSEGIQTNFTVKNIHGGSRIETVNGSVEVSELSRNVEIETINGSIVSQGLRGRIELSTVNGSIQDQDSNGRIELSTVNGPIDTNSSADVLDIQSVNATIKLHLKSVRELNVQTANARIEAVIEELLPRGDINIDSVSGKVILNLPEDVSANFSVQNHAGGHINNGLSSKKASRAKYGPGQTLEMSLNDGKADINITTISARVNLEPK